MNICGTQFQSEENRKKTHRNWEKTPLIPFVHQMEPFAIGCFYSRYYHSKSAFLTIPEVFDFFLELEGLARWQTYCPPRVLPSRRRLHSAATGHRTVAHGAPHCAPQVSRPWREGGRSRLGASVDRCMQAHFSQSAGAWLNCVVDGTASDKAAALLWSQHS